jgi:hypothetical protein
MHIGGPLDRPLRCLVLAFATLALGQEGVARGQGFSTCFEPRLVDGYPRGCSAYLDPPGPTEPPFGAGCSTCRLPWDVEEGMVGSGPWPAPCAGHCCQACCVGSTEQECRALADPCPCCHINWGRGYEDLPPPCSKPPIRWYAAADAAPLLYDLGRDVDFASLGPGGDKVVSTEDLDMLFEGGVRLVASYAIDNYWRVEGLFLGKHRWEDTDFFRDITPNTQGGTGNLFSPFTDFGSPPVLGLDFNEFAQIRLLTELQNYELNLRHRGPVRCGPVEISTIFGVRYTLIDEEFQYFTQANVPAPAGAINQVDVQAQNRLVGFQLGALMEYAVSCWCRINWEVKGALCHNRAEQRTVYTHTDEMGATTVFPGQASEGVTAFVGDTSIVCHYQLFKRVAVRLGYQAVFADGLALGVENFEPDLAVLTLGPPYINHDGTVIYHGPLLGVTVAW